MLEDERSELERRIAMVRRLALPLLDDLARERFEALLRELEQRLAKGPSCRRCLSLTTGRDQEAAEACLGRRPSFAIPPRAALPAATSSASVSRKPSPKQRGAP